MVRLIRQAQSKQVYRKVASSTKILNTLKESRRILIPLHRNPDGDAAGSALALKHVLNNLGKRVDIVSVDPLPKNLQFLPGAGRIKQTDPYPPNVSRYDLLILVDINSPTRATYQENPKIPEKMKIVCIDHHPPQADKVPTLSRIRPEASSAAEVLFDLIREGGIETTLEVAQCLLTGIITDTNRFQNATSPKVLEDAAELMRKGADLRKILFNVYRSWPPSVISLWKVILENTSIASGIVYATLRKSDLEKMRVEEDTLPTARSYAIAELLNSFEDTKAAALFTEEEGQVHINFRSREKINVGKVAEKLGGGGHERSAAANFHGTLEEAVDKTIGLLSK